MRARILLFMAALAPAACGAPEPNPYPAQARSRFEASCPPDSAVCTCTWDNLTRALTYEEYEAALARFREEGLMDPRVTHARTQCLERHRE
jgi:hypothetical protein